jgi:hypothetical protein
MLLQVDADALSALGEDNGDVRAAGGVRREVALQLAEPAAAVGSPGSAIEDEQQRSACEQVAQRVRTTVRVLERELGRR